MRQIIYADTCKEYWRVFILCDGQRKDVRWFKSPIKAIRYAYFLKHSTGLNVAKKASELLSKACETFKIQQAENTETPVATEETCQTQTETKEQSEATPKKRISRKSSKKTEEVAA